MDAPTMAKLATLWIDALKPHTSKTVKRYVDGAGLYLQHEPSGRLTFAYRYASPTQRVLVGNIRIGKDRMILLGSYSGKRHTGDLTLSEARNKAAITRALVRGGTDPLDVVEVVAPPSVPTYREVADSYIKSQEAGWRNTKTAARWRSNLALHSTPLVDLPINEVKVEHVKAALFPIWESKHFTARKFREQIVAILDAAKAYGHRSGDNPAAWAGNLKSMLKKQEAKVSHHEALDWTKIADFMPKLREIEGMGALALEFTILTAARSGETRGATWSEIDVATATWTIPADRMKMDVEHRVPLSPRAIEILQQVAPLKRSDDCIVFPGVRRGTALSDMTLLSVLKRMNVDVTVHGFRSTFRTWAGDTAAAPREIAEMSLAHAIGDAAEQAYSRSSALERRRVLMTAWADFCERVPADNVIQIKRA
jgi:integrase